MERGQIRAARALLGWSQQDLARESGVSLPTIKRLEPGRGPIAAEADTVEKLRTTFDRAGLELLAKGDESAGEGFGVRFRKPEALSVKEMLRDQLLSNRTTRSLMIQTITTFIEDEKNSGDNADIIQKAQTIIERQDAIERDIAKALAKIDPKLKFLYEKLGG